MRVGYERQVAASRWADRYCLRADEVLHATWHELADRVREGVEQFSWNELAFGPGEPFSKRVIEPAVRGWVERRVEPLIREATEEFREAVEMEPDWQGGRAEVRVCAGRELGLTDVLPGLLVPGGAAVGYGAVTAAVVTTTKLLIFTTVVIHWPLLIGGLVVGTTLACFGIYRMSDLKDRLKKRFDRTLTGQLREGLVGEGVRQNGKLTPSLLSQLQERIKAIAEEARKQLASECPP